MLKFPEDFEYVKAGYCADCDDENARLYRPRPRDNIRMVMFIPSCKRCIKALLDTGHSNISSQELLI